jgi:hypothetical protein
MIMNRRILLWQTSTFLAWFLGITIGLTLGEVLSRNLNILFYDKAGFPVGSVARNVFTGVTVGLLSGLFQSPLILSTRLSSIRWIPGNVLAFGVAFLLAEFLGFPVVRDIDYSMLLSFGFDLPPQWSPFALNFGFGNNTLGGPISAIIVGIMAGVILYLYFRKELAHPLTWIFRFSIGPTFGLVIGMIPMFFSRELLVIASVTGLSVGIIQGVLIPTYLAQNEYVAIKT